MKRLFTFLVMLTVLTFSGVAYAESNIELFQEINEHLQIAIEEANIPGMAVSIVDKDSVLFSNTYGNCESIDTPFLIGSTTKSFTALAIMRLVEQGKIDLDEPISTYICGLSIGDRVTVRQLLNQTSGFSTYQTRNNLTITDSYNKHVYANVNRVPLKTEENPGRSDKSRKKRQREQRNAGFILRREQAAGRANEIR